jgi:hypothetical protein
MNPDDRTGLLLTERLTTSTAHLTARADAAEQAARGGRRRLRRRWTALAGGALVLALTVTVPSGMIRDRIERATTPARTEDGDLYGKLLDRPTQGDLAGDAAYRTKVLNLWDRQARNFSRGLGDDRRGEPHLAWAGTTPAGPAAVVVQLAYLHEHEQLNIYSANRFSTLIGYYGVAGDGRPELVDYDFWDTDHGSTVGVGAWFVDPEHAVLAVRDVGFPVGWGAQWDYRADGERELLLKELTFRDGAAVVALPSGVDRTRVMVSRMPFRPYRNDNWVQIAGQQFPEEKGRELDWPNLQLAGTGPIRVADPGQVFRAVLESRTFGVRTGDGGSNWLATGRLDDGRDVLVGDVTLEDDPSHSYAVLVSPDGEETVVHGGAVDPQAPAPIMIRLPDRAGWVIARAETALSWRTGAGSWHDAGTGAALVPAAATEIGVTAPGGSRTAVPLP